MFKNKEANSADERAVWWLVAFIVFLCVGGMLLLFYWGPLFVWEDIDHLDIVFVGSEAYEKKVANCAITPEQAAEAVFAWEGIHVEGSVPRHKLILDGNYVFSFGDKQSIFLTGYYVDCETGEVRYVGAMKPGSIPYDQAKHLGFDPTGNGG